MTDHLLKILSDYSSAPIPLRISSQNAQIAQTKPLNNIINKSSLFRYLGNITHFVGDFFADKVGKHNAEPLIPEPE